MRRHAARAGIFAAIVAAHLLALHYLPDFGVRREVSEREPATAITLVAAVSRQARPAVSRARPRSRNARAKRAPSSAMPAAQPSGHPGAIQPWVDWEKEADAAIAHHQALAAEAERQAAALSRWREHVMPAPWAPHGPQFRWDYAATHRLVSTPGGLVINVSDRCFIVTTGLMLLPVCRIGAIPAHGDLFAHMDDPKDPAEASAP